MAAIDGIDHGVIMVRDLDMAAERWRRLGFMPTPRGTHSAHLGTANHCLMFPRDYLELLAVLQPTEANAPWREALQGGEGLKALALAGESAEAAGHALTQAGLHPSAPLDFSRPVRIGSTVELASFRIIQLPPDSAPGLALFVCQHFTRPLVWVNGSMEHPNGVQGLRGVTVAVNDPAGAAAAYGRVFGTEPIAAAEGAMVVPAGPATIRLVTPPQAAALYPAAGFPPSPPYAAGIHLAVADAGRAWSLLAGNGVPHWVTEDGAIRVSPGDASGVVLSFEEARPI